MDDSRERKSLSLPSYRERLVEESRKGGGGKNGNTWGGPKVILHVLFLTIRHIYIM